MLFMENKTVTLGWDGLPTIVNEDGTIYPRRAELIFHEEYYPNWPEEKWPIDPATKERLPIESRGSEVLQRYTTGNHWRSFKGLAVRIGNLVQALFRKKQDRTKNEKMFSG